jgi:outer membrane autotransporter protein
MNTYNDKSSTHPAFQRTRLGRAISLLLAGVFAFCVTEAEAEENGVELSADGFAPPSSAAAIAAPSYLLIAMRARDQVPLVFTRQLLGAPAPLVITSANGIGIANAGAHDDTTVNLSATRTIGVLAQAASSVGFERGTVNSTALTAANAHEQTALLARDGGQLSGTGVTVNLVPKAANGAIITANNMTGISAQAGGQVSLRDSAITLGGGVNGLNNQGLVAVGTGSRIDFLGGSVSTQSKGSIAALAQEGGKITLGQGSTLTTTGANSPTTGSHALKADGVGSQISASQISVSTKGTQANAARAENGAGIDLDAATLDTGSAVYGHGLLATGNNSQISLNNGSVTTAGKGAVGAWARDGARIQLGQGTQISTSGASISNASAPLDEKTLSISHGLLASGNGSRIDAADVTVRSSAVSASGARAEAGAIIQLERSELTSTGAATSTSSTAVLHAVGGSSILADAVHASAIGNYIGGIRADGSGSKVTFNQGSVTLKGAGSVADFTSAARAMNSGAVSIEGSALSSQGTFSHGVSVEGNGSRGTLTGSSIDVGGARAHGVYVNGGASADVISSTIRLDPAASAVGPWGLGALVEGQGSRLRLNDSEVRTSQKTSYGVRALAGAELELNNGLIDTQGNYSAGLSAGSATVIARNLSVRTSGDDNAMGVVADTGSTITLYGGSVTTSGNGSPVQSNLTFPHALASRNQGAQLNAYGTSVQTLGSQAYGAAVDDGGSMLLEGLTVKTAGQYSTGLYAGIGTLKPGQVSLTARNVSVETLGQQASGALVSRQYQTPTATLDLIDSTLTTRGQLSHGLQAESGAQLSASNSAVSTHGDSALGVLANNQASVQLDQVGVNTRGDLAHALVAKNGGVLDVTHSTINADGGQAAALYSQGTDVLKGQANVDNSVLHNREGATVAVAGVADIKLSDSIVGGSGRWLNVDRAVASDGSQVPDMGTGLWQGVGRSLASAGNANIDVAGSVLNGSARTAGDSHSTVNLRDTSLWNLTGESNLGTLRNESSLIDFSAPLGGQFKSLTVNDYHGANGTFALNTYLYTDGSPSDKLVVDGGKADGSSNLLIKNAGGPGAVTQGNGILVVDAVNGATTTPDAFRLLSRVKAGPYEYSLHRASQDGSNTQAWYLRSTRDAEPVEPVLPVVPVVPVEPVVPVNPVEPVIPVVPVGPQVPVTPITPSNPLVPVVQPQQPLAPVRPQVPNYRAETSLYRALPAMLLHYSHAMVDTLHERVGEERRMTTDPPPVEEVDSYGPSLGWGRLIHRQGNDELGDNVRSDYRIQAFQVGADLYRNEDIDGSTDQAGLSLNIGRIAGSIEHSDGANAGEDLLHAYGVGGYWTHFGPEGWYLDGVLQFNRFDIKATPNDMDALKTRAHGVTASLESGYPFHAENDKNLHVEPQAQVIVSKVRIDDSHDDFAQVRFEDMDSLTGRLGVRIDKDWFREDDKGKVHRTNGWIRPSVWHEFKGSTKTEFSSADGYVPFGTDMSGTWGELNLGVDYQVDERTTVTGSLGYQKAFGEDSRSYEGILGIKVKF